MWCFFVLFFKSSPSPQLPGLPPTVDFPSSTVAQMTQKVSQTRAARRDDCQVRAGVLERYLNALARLPRVVADRHYVAFLDSPDPPGTAASRGMLATFFQSAPSLKNVGLSPRNAGSTVQTLTVIVPPYPRLGRPLQPHCRVRADGPLQQGGCRCVGVRRQGHRRNQR